MHHIMGGDYVPPLYGAASQGKNEVVKLLLENGANINRRFTLNGPPLFAAIYGNHLETTELLLSHGADVNFQNGDETALQIAKSKGNERMVSLLKKYGATE